MCACCLAWAGVAWRGVQEHYCITIGVNDANGQLAGYGFGLPPRGSTAAGQGQGHTTGGLALNPYMD